MTRPDNVELDELKMLAQRAEPPFGRDWPSGPSTDFEFGAREMFIEKATPSVVGWLIGRVEELEKERDDDQSNEEVSGCEVFARGLEVQEQA